MSLEEFTETWKEICFILSKSVNTDMVEKEYEYHVMKAVETLGWKEYKKEIKRQPVIKIGHGKKLQPDLVIYDGSSEPLIAIEVKRPADDLTKGDVSSQLKSYMLMLKTEYGLLIGKTIRFFYDGNLYKSKNTPKGPVLLGEFKFVEESEKGQEFISNINKESLCKSNHTQYLKNLIKKVQEKNTIKELLPKLLSKEAKNIVLDNLRNVFSGEYGAEIVEGALKFVDIQIKPIEDLHDDKGAEVSKKTKDSPNGNTIKGKILGLIQVSKNGISIKEIYSKLGLSRKQVSNQVHRLKKKGFIKTVSPGVYVATHHQTIKLAEKPSKPTMTIRGKVLKIIAGYKNGARAAKIRERTGFGNKQVSNALNYLIKKEKIIRTETGFYKAV